jgi:hypothetical protein
MRRQRIANRIASDHVERLDSILRVLRQESESLGKPDTDYKWGYNHGLSFAIGAVGAALEAVQDGMEARM